MLSGLKSKLILHVIPPRDLYDRQFCFILFFFHNGNKQHKITDMKPTIQNLPAQVTSLVVQWLRLHLIVQEVRVRSAVGELRSYMPQGQKIKTRNRSNIAKSVKTLKMAQTKADQRPPHSEFLSWLSGSRLAVLSVIPHPHPTLIKFILL